MNAIGKRLKEAMKGDIEYDPMGAVRGLPRQKRYLPSKSEAEAACTFNGRVRRDIMETFMQGDFMKGAKKMVENDIIKKWTAGTWQTKKRVVILFFKFLKATGLLEEIFQDGEPMENKSSEDRKKEELALCGFAILRVMAGQKPSGAEGYVSHVRTWFRTMWQDEFGQIYGVKLTSSYLVAMTKVYESENQSEDVRREPVTWEMCVMFMEKAKRKEWEDIGIVTAVAYAALFRMGELTATSCKPFDPVKGLTEDKVEFSPTFWTATSVTITMACSKADQSGVSSRLRPRMLAIGDDAMAPGRRLRDMLATRHKVTRGVNPVLGKAPLFQDKNKGQLKQSAVLAFMRHTLTQAGFSKEQVARYGTHSCRIGGATRLFQMGAIPEVIKHLGGWASEAYRTYVRIQQQDLMRFSTKMCE